eukprot:CAMPEP_0172312898 /NCGR_PEP_ID=MMETSP1058-20130122/18752_1 /TAXON_ID=83371 /ORGANISM="Detonula confervacea, Strain CCMP 353" /LENGTH=240 /DNA_ID=CAMNT_0013026455 /DNA_START=50 /DNA_END=772 /DNA_ORIENTATION=+
MPMRTLKTIWFLFFLAIIGSLSGATAGPTLKVQPTAFASLPRSTFHKGAHIRSNCINDGYRSRTITRHAAPEGALSDIVIPSIFNLSDWKNANNDEEEDPRVWVPQTDCLSFRPLCFCTSQGYYVNLLKFTGGGILGRHRHSSPVHAVTFKGSWGYREHEWHANPGTYVFEPPGETHTLVVDEDCEEMVALFHVTGSLLYVSEETGEVTGFDDVFTKLEKARDWYGECGLGRDYVDQFIR